MFNGLIYDPETERIDEINEDLTIIQRKNGLTFGTDAYLLSAFAKHAKYAKAADFGCGTGVISLLTVQKGKYAHVFAFEVQRTFAELTRRNVELNKLSEKISVVNKDIREISQSILTERSKRCL